MTSKRILSNLTLLLCFSLLSLSTIADDENSCVYTVYTRTSTTFIADTTSKISVTFYDETGSGIHIKDLELWGGLMGKDWEYYQKGNLDIFSGRGPCLDKPICYMELVSDGSGGGWYCNYVEITSTGPHIKCAQQLFTVEQWLSVHRYPFSLSTTRDLCNNTDVSIQRRRPTGSSVLPVESLLPASS